MHTRPLALGSLLAALVSLSAFADSIILQEQALPSCGGSAKVSLSNDGHGGERINISMKRVQSCSDFLIRLSNGAVLQAYKLQKHGQDYSGSYSIPKRDLRDGFNSFVIEMQSNSGLHADEVSVRLLADDGDAVLPLPPRRF